MSKPASAKLSLTALFAAAAKGELVQKSELDAAIKRNQAIEGALTKGGLTLAADATPEGIESAITGALAPKAAATGENLLLVAAASVFGLTIAATATAEDVKKLFGDALQVKIDAAIAAAPATKKLSNLTAALSAKGVKLPAELADEKAPEAIGQAVDLRLGALLADAMLAQGFDANALPGNLSVDADQPGEHLAEYRRLMVTDPQAAGEYYAAHKDKILTK